MPRRVILLANDANCGQSQLIANAILRGYNNEIAVSLYNYRNGHCYNYTVAGNAFNVADRGQVIQVPAWTYVRDMLGVTNAALNNAIDERQLWALGRLTQYFDGMTTVDRKRIPGEWMMRVLAELNAVQIEYQRDTLCFIIAPNPRNAPIRLQTYGHKLHWSNGAVRYRRRSGGDFSVAHLAENKGDAVASVTEMAFCRTIFNSAGYRYLGNCYGAQIMWLSMGGGLTSYKRNLTAPHDATFVHPTKNQPTLNVDWAHGLTIGGRVDGDANNRNPITHQAMLTNHEGVTYNTDYFHSCMMITSKAIDKLNKLAPVFAAQSHEFAGLISGDQDLANSNEFLQRLRKYADSDRWRSRVKPSHANKQQRSWEWIGEYHFDDRIAGFQGHPLLYLHIAHANQKHTQAYMKEQLFGPDERQFFRIKQG